MNFTAPKKSKSLEVSDEKTFLGISRNDFSVLRIR